MRAYRSVVGGLTLAMVGAVGACGGAPPGAPSSVSQAEKGKKHDDHPVVADPSRKYEDHSYGEWSAKWWQWALSIPLARSPLFDLTGAHSLEGQKGPVYYLAGIFCVTDQNGVCTADPIPPLTRTITIPSDVALFFPIINSEIDSYLTPAPSSVAGFCLDLYDFGTDQYTDPAECARRDQDYAANLSAEIDGVAVDGLDNAGAFRVQPPHLFTYQMPDHNMLGAFGLPDGAATVKHAGADGVFVMVEPMSPGEHTVHFKGEVVIGGQTAFALDITYNVTVTGHDH